MNRKQIRILFFLIIGTFILQFPVMMKFGLFFPGIIGPGFMDKGGAPQMLNIESCSMVIQSENRAEITLPPTRLFYDVQPYGRWILPRTSFSYRSENQIPASPAVKQWLKNRIQYIEPGLEPTQLTFVWSNIELYYQAKPVRRDTHLLGTFPILLN